MFWAQGMVTEGSEAGGRITVSRHCWESVSLEEPCKSLESQGPGFKCWLHYVWASYLNFLSLRFLSCKLTIVPKQL